ncbi:MAG: hypothetical protein Q9173_003077 [Seirophora scorigena]
MVTSYTYCIPSTCKPLPSAFHQQPVPNQQSPATMDYFIDDMLNTPRRGTTRNNATSPEPPLPPSPAPTKIKKSKNAILPRNMKDVSSPAAVPLPDTPTPPSIRLQAGPSASQAAQPSARSSIPARITEAESGYFTAVELTPPASGTRGPPVPGAFTPISEFAVIPPGLPTPARESPFAVSETGESSAAAEEHNLVAQPEEQSDATKVSSEDGAGSPPPVFQLARTPTPTDQSKSVVMIGLSGAPASGKTTLAHLLAAILPPLTPSFIIHQDDFFVRKHLLIPGADGEIGVEYRRTVDFSALKQLMSYSKEEGQLPPGFRSLQPEENRERALSRMSPELIENMRASLANLPSFREGQPVGIVDGFMLFHSKTIRDMLDVKILLRASKEVSKLRREEHTKDVDGLAGKVGHPWETLDYFDRVLWPNYVGEHAVLFEDRVVDGRPVSDVCKGVGIAIQPKLVMSVEEVLHWVAEILRRKCGEDGVRRERGLPSAGERKGDFEHCGCDEGLLGKLRRIIFNLV